jgi:hypothetical protein
MMMCAATIVIHCSDVHHILVDCVQMTSAATAVRLLKWRPQCARLVIFLARMDLSGNEVSTRTFVSRVAGPATRLLGEVVQKSLRHLAALAQMCCSIYQTPLTRKISLHPSKDIPKVPNSTTKYKLEQTCAQFICSNSNVYLYIAMSVWSFIYYIRMTKLRLRCTNIHWNYEQIYELGIGRTWMYSRNILKTVHSDLPGLPFRQNAGGQFETAPTWGISNGPQHSSKCSTFPFLVCQITVHIHIWRSSTKWNTRGRYGSHE